MNSQVPLAAEMLFGPGPQAREAFAWQLPQQILFASWQCLAMFGLEFCLRWNRHISGQAADKAEIVPRRLWP